MLLRPAGVVPLSPSLGSINLLEWLSVYQFTLKDVRKDTDESQMKYLGRGMWKGLPCLLQGTTLPAPPHVHQPGNSLNLILLSSYGGFIT